MLVDDVSETSSASFNTPSHSASQILTGGRACVYDVFCHPCGPDEYLPNSRLACIHLESDIAFPEINVYEHQLRDLLFPDSWSVIEIDIDFMINDGTHQMNCSCSSDVTVAN